MTPDRLSRRAALSMVVLVIALLITMSACTKKQPSQTAATESVTASTATGTTATDTGAALAMQSIATDTTGTGGPLVMDKATIDKMTHPVVMVDAKTFKVDQKEARLFDFEPDTGNPHQPSTRAVRIYWRTTTGKGNLALTFKETNCVSAPVCKPGECSATALPHPKPGTRCTYVLTLDDNNVDPVIIVDPCCP